MQSNEKLADSKLLVWSLGGSAIFERENPTQLDVPYIHGYLSLLTELLTAQISQIVIVGGGRIARLRINDVKRAGVRKDDQLDHVGIAVSRVNAVAIRSIAESRDMITYRYPRDEWDKPAILVGGGNRPGHTTDAVAVEAAIENKAQYVINIGEGTGLYNLMPDGELDRSSIIPHINSREFLKMFGGKRIPGENIPFDRQAIHLARKARKHKISGIFMVGKDLDNVRNLVSGRDFVGTYIDTTN